MKSFVCLNEHFFKRRKKILKQLHSKKNIVWQGTFKDTHFKKHFLSALNLGPTQPILKIFLKCVYFYLPSQCILYIFFKCVMMVNQQYINKR